MVVQSTNGEKTAIGAIAVIVIFLLFFHPFGSGGGGGSSTITTTQNGSTLTTTLSSSSTSVSLNCQNSFLSTYGVGYSPFISVQHGIPITFTITATLRGTSTVVPNLAINYIIFNSQDSVLLNQNGITGSQAAINAGSFTFTFTFPSAGNYGFVFYWNDPQGTACSPGGIIAN